MNSTKSVKLITRNGSDDSLGLDVGLQTAHFKMLWAASFAEGAGNRIPVRGHACATFCQGNVADGKPS
jgi:hypothetical protein